MHFSEYENEEVMSEGGHTVAAQFEVENIADTDVNNAEETLVSPFKLALVEDLDCDHGRIVRDGTIPCKKINAPN
jgi:hypothetical protein